MRFNHKKNQNNFCTKTKIITLIITKIIMTSQIEFTNCTKQEELLRSKKHYYMTNSYKELYMIAGNLNETIPILTFDKNGALDIVVGHKYFIGKNETEYIFRDILTSK